MPRRDLKKSQDLFPTHTEFSKYVRSSLSLSPTTILNQLVTAKWHGVGVVQEKLYPKMRLKQPYKQHIHRWKTKFGEELCHSTKAQTKSGDRLHLLGSISSKIQTDSQIAHRAEQISNDSCRIHNQLCIPPPGLFIRHHLIKLTIYIAVLLCLY